MDGLAYKTPLQRERKRRGWTLARVVDELNQLAAKLGYGELGVDANAVSRYERGVIRFPRPPYPELFASLYGVDIGELWPEDGAAISLEAAEYARLMDMDRRTVLILLHGALGGLAIDGAHQRLARTVERFAAVDAAGVRAIQGGIANARRLDDCFGAQAAARPALAQHQLVGRLLGRSHPEPLERTLWSAAGEVSQLLGWLCFDMGDQRAAAAHFNEALRAARHAGDDVLAGYVTAYLAITAIYAGRPAEGLALAEAATARARRATATVRSWLATVEAEAHANLGDAAATERALDAAEAALAASAPGDDPGWIYHHDRSGITSAAGSCWLVLNQPARARAAMQATMTLSAPTVVREEAVYLTRLGATYVPDGEIAEACRLGTEALAIARDTESDRGVQRVRELRRELDPWARSPAVRELDEQLRTL